MCVWVCVFGTLLVNAISRDRRIEETPKVLKLGTWMSLIERKNPIVFGGGQRSRGVTGVKLRKPR